MAVMEGSVGSKVLAFLALGIAAASVAACIPDDIAREAPVGACVDFHGSVDAEFGEIGPADCSGPHTHVVSSWVADRNATCPAPATGRFRTPGGMLCLRADPSPSASP